MQLPFVGSTDDYFERMLWTAVAGGSALIAATATWNALNATWRLLREEEPPQDLVSPRTGWTEAIVWTAVTGVAAGLTQLAARRGAAAGWKRVMGRYPPGVLARETTEAA